MLWYSLNFDILFNDIIQYLDIEMIYWYFDASEHHYVCETGLCVCVCGSEFVTAVFCDS